MQGARTVCLEYLIWAVRQDGTVASTIVAYELIQRVSEIRKRELCMFLCIICGRGNDKYFITNRLSNS